MPASSDSPVRAQEPHVAIVPSMAAAETQGDRERRTPRSAGRDEHAARSTSDAAFARGRAYLLRSGGGGDGDVRRAAPERPTNTAAARARSEFADGGRTLFASLGPAPLAALPANPPVFDFFGAYLPAWLPAMGLGFLAMVLLRATLAVFGLHQRMPGRVFVYIAATVLFSCLAWLAMA